jgi:hypothetical protein
MEDLDNRQGSFGNDEVEDEIELDDDLPEGDEGSDESPLKSNYEEIPDSLPEESMANDPEKVDKHGKKRDKAQTRINQIQRERYQALSALEAARAENERLRQMQQLTEQRAELSSQAALRHYDDNVSTRLERARAQQIAAIESGDAQAQADANIEIAAATAAMQELKNWKYKEEYERRHAEQAAQRAQQEQMYQPVPQQPAYNPNDVLLEDWVEKNDWYNPESENHDPDLAAHVSQLANQLDYQLANSGYAYRIKSPEYFQYIDNAIQQHLSKRNTQPSNQGRSLNMRTPHVGAYSARNGRSMQAQSQRRSALSDEQRDMARRMGVSDKAYAESVKWHEANKSARHGG